MATTHFEDFTSGQVIELGSVTLTEEAIIDFATQFDPQSFHIDPVIFCFYSKNRFWGRWTFFSSFELPNKK